MNTLQDDNFGNYSDFQVMLVSKERKKSRLMKLFEEELKDIYGAEKEGKRAIHRMIESATSDDLIDALDNHLAQTKMHIMRVERVFELMGKIAMAKKNEAIEGLIKETKERMKSSEKGAVRDAGIISVAQKMEHYEIASYGTLRQFAKTLELTEVVKLLEQILSEEKAANQELTCVAVSEVNVRAVA